MDVGISGEICIQSVSEVVGPEHPYFINLLFIQQMITGTSLAVQWLRLQASTSGGAGSIPGQGTKIPHAPWHGRK